MSLGHRERGVETLVLRTDDLLVEIDSGRGADITALVDRHSGLDVLFQVPWRERADALREGQQSSTRDPVAEWFEHYRGGWQTLCPVAGDPRRVHGAPVAFHGEASVVPWIVQDSSPQRALLQVDLFSVPLRIEREIRLIRNTVQQVDVISNRSDVPIDFDYASHPAFGGTFLSGECIIDSGAKLFTSDPESETALRRGSIHTWPHGKDNLKQEVDLRRVPDLGEPRHLLGWLSEFESSWASITNADLGLTTLIEWDSKVLPYAWVWQELNATATFPWYQRARAIAIEPASCQTGGPERRSSLTLSGRASVTIPIAITLAR